MFTAQSKQSRQAKAEVKPRLAKPQANSSQPNSAAGQGRSNPLWDQLATQIHGGVGAKQKISPPDDPKEREADFAAERIMRSQAGPPMAAARPSTGAIEHGALTTANQVIAPLLRSAGRPLEPATRSFFEPRFGRDFSDVHVHTGEEAAES